MKWYTLGGSIATRSFVTSTMDSDKNPQTRVAFLLLAAVLGSLFGGAVCAQTPLSATLLPPTAEAPKPPEPDYMPPPAFDAPRCSMDTRRRKAP